MIYQPMISGGVLPFPSNYRQISTVYLPIPLSIALLSKTWNVSRLVIGSVAMRVRNVFRDTLISAAQVNSLLSDGTEQLIGPERERFASSVGRRRLR